MKKLKVAMVAPPWLEIPPDGYGGIENVVHALAVDLQKLGVEVHLFSVKASHIAGVQNHWLYDTGQYQHIAKSLYESAPVAIGQVLFALNAIRESGDFDIIHDHNGFIGPAVMSYAQDFPPMIHTYHGPPFSGDIKRNPNGYPENRHLFEQLGEAGRVYFVGVSNALMLNAPESLKPYILPAIYNAVDASGFPFEPKKQNYYAAFGRISRDKGQALAVKLCLDLGYPLKIAGIIDATDLTTVEMVNVELSNPHSAYNVYPSFGYYRREILPFLEVGKIEYLGNLPGDQKLRYLADAKAFLFPIDWEEPFGMVLIEALACGTPVVAMRRGAVPEIIEHGVNGWLADTEAEFKEYMQRTGEIDPAACRRSVENKFSSSTMAAAYLEAYQRVISREKRG